MYISSLRVERLNSIDELDLSDLKRTVVLAGPNGSGKSALLRLLSMVSGSARQSASGLVETWRARAGGPSCQCVLSFSDQEQQALETSPECPVELALPSGLHPACCTASGVPPLLSARWKKSHALEPPTIHRIEANRILTGHFASGDPMSLLRTSQNGRLGRRSQRDASFSGLPADLYAMFLDEREQPAGGGDQGEFTRRFYPLVNDLLDSKSFQGPVVDNPLPHQCTRVDFPVETERGVHDPSALGDGELQLLMLAYTVVTRMRGGSIVLVDEPDLHLHPAIALRLMEAMRAATDAAGGQLWVATHSPEIIDATNLATESLVVLPGGGKGRNVALPITSDDATLGLLEQLGAGVSALAHRRKLVWAEGESDHRLLREFHRDVKRAKFIRAGSKDTVQRASQAVKRAIDEVAHYNFLIAIIDGDRDLALQKIGLGTPTATDPEHGFFVWDRYGIENYLLDAEAILKVHSDLSDARQFASATEVERALKDVADGTLGSLIDSCINARLPRNPLHGATFSRSATPNDLRAAATAYVQRLSKSLPSPDSVATDAHKVCKGVTDLWPEEWRVLCPGKDVLRKFHALHAGKVISYLTYCDYIARAIRDAESWDRRLREVLKAICGPLEDLD